MRHFGMFVVLAAAASTIGCGQGASISKGGIAVVDLDKVAAETGRTRVLDESLGMAERSLNQSLTKYFESAKEQVSAKKKSYGDNLSADEQKELVAFERTESVKLSQIKTQAQNQLVQYRQKQIADFRNELKPIAQEIAAKRGLGIVVPKNDGILLSIDPGVDITDEVVKALREKRPTPAAAEQVAAPFNRSARPAAAQVADADDEEEAKR